MAHPSNTEEYKVQLTASIGALPRMSHHTDHFIHKRCNLGATMLHGTSLAGKENVTKNCACQYGLLPCEDDKVQTWPARSIDILAGISHLLKHF